PHLMKNGGHYATGRAADGLLAADYADVGLADAAGIRRIEVEINVIRFAGVGNELDDASECVVELRDRCGEGAGWIGAIGDDVRHLRHPAHLRPKAAGVRNARALCGVAAARLGPGPLDEIA